MKKVHYMAVAEKVMEQIREGAFLTVTDGTRLNTMAIGWGMVGFVWRKPVFMVAVRDSRHTYTLLEKAADFTVSMPGGDMKNEVMFCGTKSGRDVDKFEALNLKTKTAETVASPLIDTPGIHFECKIIFKSPMDPAFLDGSLKNLYPQKDYHTLYFGEILAAYEL